MADYFIVLDGKLFQETLRPALADSWRTRSFAPCLPLVERLAPAARDYTREFHTGAQLPLLLRLEKALTFDRAVWRALAGEVLLFAAAELPEFPTNLDSLVHLLAPGGAVEPEAPRDRQPPVRQALAGSRDVTFGSACYRPGHAGYNAPPDVTRLADYLKGVDPDAWAAGDLAGLPGASCEEDRHEELAFAREWFPALCGLYQRARDSGQVLVIERLY